MKFVLAFSAIISLASNVNGLSCYSCYAEDFNGEDAYIPACYLNSGDNPSLNTSCGTDSNSTFYYCRTTFDIQDGVISSVRRGCTSTNSSSSAGESCNTTLQASGDPTVNTTCVYLCKNKDDCNNQTQTSLKTCSSNCSIDVGGGSCNYITGHCVCNPGYTESNCSSESATKTPIRKCYQCNSLIDNDCSATNFPTSTTECTPGENYCSTTTTSILDPSGSVPQSVYTRGCTDSFVAVDECSFTNIYDDPPLREAGYNEFTCYSTCDTDGCNTNKADGKINGNEKVVLQCVQCSDLTGDGTCSYETERTPCLSSESYCKTTVNYMLSQRNDLSYQEAVPIYKLVSLVRECATSAVAATCTSVTSNSLSFENVTCTESCQTDGCNTGWPARPKCLRCETDLTNNGYDRCLQNPEEATDCDYPYQQYCVIQEYGIQTGGTIPVQGYPHAIVRGCSHYNIGTGCSVTTPRSTEIANCNRTCTTDGCNVGSGSTMPQQAMVALIVPGLAAWMAQYSV